MRDPNWALSARQSVIRASGELLDEAADYMVTAQQRARRAKETSAVLNERELRYAFDKVVDLSTSGSPAPLVALAEHFSALADIGDVGVIRAHAQTLIDYLYQRHNRHDEPREKWITEETVYFADMIDMDDQRLPEAERDMASLRSDAQEQRRSERVE
jgi:hypothetical protein